ncbi:CD99 molecule isoform X1 [Toxotes jaculatrix]|uniref:CD99 molecule isoform X1 n=1 Tax=Toxotes jaculatrix TaxID=941984 RepID=UPI001B3B17B2|nr:CD99 molecule isoform X1 [Toxotes jaculatrix]
MEFCLRLALLLLLVIGTLTQDGFDLSDALDDLPKEKPKVTEKPKTDDTKPKPDKPADTPPKTSGGGDFGFDLGDALDTDTNPKPDKPADKPKPPKTSGGDSGTFSDSDLFDVRDGDYKPDGGRSGGGRAVDPDPQGGADQPQAAGSGPIAGIASAIGVALLGAASSYFAYQKKKLCFKLQGGADPESGKGQGGTHSDPQVLSNLLRTN